MDFLIGWPGGDWQATARLAGTLAGGYLALIWLASVLWVYRDVAGRTRDPVSQTVSVAIVVVMPLIGLPIYFALRPNETLQEAHDREIEQEAMLSEMQSLASCPSCRRAVESTFMSCAYCGTALQSPCASCGQPLRAAFRFCPHCATPRAQIAEPQRPVRLDFSVDDGFEDAPPPEDATPPRRPATAAARDEAQDPHEHRDPPAPEEEAQPEALQAAVAEVERGTARPAVRSTSPFARIPDEPRRARGATEDQDP